MRSLLFVLTAGLAFLMGYAAGDGAVAESEARFEAAFNTAGVLRDRTDEVVVAAIASRVLCEVNRGELDDLRALVEADGGSDEVLVRIDEIGVLMDRAMEALPVPGLHDVDDAARIGLLKNADLPSARMRADLIPEMPPPPSDAGEGD